MISIVTKGRTFKVSGLPIKRVPKDKVCIMTGFHIINHNDNRNEVVKQGELSLVSNESYDKNTVLDIRCCKFECKYEVS